MVIKQTDKPTFDKKSGHELRKARLNRRLSIDEIANHLRVPPAYLIALEEADLSVFPAEVYAKGAYKKYTSYLGHSSNEAWNAFLRTLAGSRQTAPLRIPLPSGWVHRVLTPAGFFIAMVALVITVIAGYIGLQISDFLSVPEIKLAAPNEVILKRDSVVVKGTAEEEAEISINNESILLNEDNQFSYQLPLSPGINVLQIKAVGVSGRTNIVEKHLLVPRS